MQFFIIKTLISALIIAAVSELAKRYTWIAGLLASLPLLSILAFLWLYVETKNSEKVIELSKSIFFAVIPSLIFFVALPVFLRLNLNFYLSLVLSMIVMVLCYSVYLYCLSYFGVDVV